MFNKLLNIILLSISISLVLSNLNEEDDDGVYIELPKYGKVEFDKQSWLYMDLTQFKKGDKIHLEFVFCAIMFYNEVPLKFSETNDYKKINPNNNKVIKDNQCYQEIDGYTIDHGCNYYYEITGNFKYLIIITPRFESRFYLIGNQYIEHIRNNLGLIIMIGIVSGLIVISLIIFLVIHWKKKYKKNVINNDNDYISKQKIAE